MPKSITGLAAPLPLSNVDTDVIMPKRFLVTITREGLGDGAFADLRFKKWPSSKSWWVRHTRIAHIFIGGARTTTNCIWRCAASASSTRR